MRHILLVLLSVIFFTAGAQTRSDLIYKLDKGSFSAIVDEIGDEEIIYYLPADVSKQSLLRINRQEVWKIVYSNGEIETINTPSVAPPVVSNPTTSASDRIFLKNKTLLTGKIVEVSETKIEYRQDDSGPVFELLSKDLVKIEYGDGRVEEFGRKVSHSANPEKSSVDSVKREGKNLLGKLSLTAGLDAGYYFGSKDWIDEEDGLGFRTSLGGSLRLGFKISKPIGVYFTTGYSGASVERNYLDGGAAAYKETYSMAGAHAGLGVKYFLNESVYILGEGKANFLKLTGTYSEDGDVDKYAVSAICPSFSAGIGFTKKISRIIIEADIHYQFTQSAFKDMKDPIHLIGARLGIGLSDLFKK